jgi:hypothetical protein
MGVTVRLRDAVRVDGSGSVGPQYVCIATTGEEFRVDEVSGAEGCVLANYQDVSGKWHPLELSPNPDGSCDLTYREPGEVTWTVGYGRDARAWRSSGKPPRGEPGCVWESVRPDPSDVIQPPRGLQDEAAPGVVSSAIVDGLKRLAAEAEADGPVVIRLRLLSSFLKWSTNPDDVGIGTMIGRHAAQAKHYGARTWAEYEARRDAELAARLDAELAARAKDRQRPTAPPTEEERLSNPYW